MPNGTIRGAFLDHTATNDPTQAQVASEGGRGNVGDGSRSISRQAVRKKEVLRWVEKSFKRSTERGETRRKTQTKRKGVP